MMKSEKILMVDDEIGMCRLLKEALSEEGYVVETLQQSSLALKRIEESPFDLVISDVRMPKVNGMDLLKAIKAAHPRLPVVIMTAYGSVESAVEAMKQGAADYITKPFKTDEMKILVAGVFEKVQLSKENEQLKAVIADRYGFKNIIGQTPKMVKIFELMHRVKDTPTTVLIFGESGTGKELISKVIHFNSVRKDKPFVAINCGAVPEHLLESELFGHQKGAFPDASSAKPGLLETANGGTVFLDEIGDMALNLQSKLLRFLQEGEIRRVGSTETLKVDVRVIAATQQDLTKATKEGRFREDLYYRLAVVPIHIPPLRERKEDIPLLVDYLLKDLSKKLGRSLVCCEAQALEVLMSRDWPGNVRELQNALEYAASISVSPVLKKEHFLSASSQPSQETPNLNRLPYRDAKQKVLEKFERAYLEDLLKRADGNISQAARLADMDRKNLYELLKKYDLKTTEESGVSAPQY